MAIIIKDPFLCTFIHIPKTGGTSISTWLNENFSTQTSKGKKHCNVDVAKELFENLGLTYCVVRNPWDLVVSWYHFKGQRAIRRKELILSNKKTFKGKWTLEYIENEIKLYELGFENFVYTNDLTQQIVYADQCDYILKFESLNEDFKFIQQKLNCSKPLPFMNQSIRNKNYQSYYSDKTKEIIQKQFQDDIYKFEYKF